jgi:hypothetical protein
MHAIQLVSVDLFDTLVEGRGCSGGAISYARAPIPPSPTLALTIEHCVLPEAQAGEGGGKPLFGSAWAQVCPSA